MTAPTQVPQQADGGSISGAWTLDYIEDAATKRVTVRSRDGRSWPGNSNYCPPTTGIHLCGQTDDGEQPTTVAVYPMHRRDVLDRFEAAKAVAECDPDESDFVVDLYCDDDLEMDFHSNRQLWPRAIAAWNGEMS